MAARIPTAQAVLLNAARELEEAVVDKDGVVGPDEHFKITTALVDAERQLSGLAAKDRGLATDAALVTALKLDLYKQADAAQGWFKAYKPMISDGRPEIAAGDKALDWRIGDASAYVTYLPKARFDALLGSSWVAEPPPQGGQSYDVDANDYVYSSFTYRDTRSGRVLSAHQLFGEVKQAMVQQGSLKVGGLEAGGEVEHRTLDLVAGVGSANLPRETVRNIRLPDFLSKQARDVNGVRLAWVVGDALVRRGLMTEATLRGFIDRHARGDAAALGDAARAMAPNLRHLEVVAGNSYAAAFGHGPDGLEYALAHGVLALSHREDMTQVLPDYTMTESGKALVRTPVGPMMLLYDAPEGTGAYPAKQRYVFNVESVRLHVTADVPGAAAGIDLAAVEAQFLGVATAIKNVRKSPPAVQATARSHQAAMQALLGKLAPAIRVRETELAQARLEAESREAAEKGLWLWLTDKPETKAAKRRVAELETWLEKAQGLEAGLNIALRLGLSDAERQSEASYRGRLDAAARGIAQRSRPDTAATAAWETEIRNLLLVEEEVLQATRAAITEKQSTAQDLTRFDSITRWHEDWAAWIDWLSFGISARGNLFRQGKTQTAAAKGYANQLESVSATGEAAVRTALHPLLLETNEQYRADYATYSKLKPAYDQLVNVMQGIDDCQHALRTAEYYIRYRDFLRITEPTKYESVAKQRYVGKDSNGNDQYETYYEDEITSAWRSWRSQLDSAEMMCMIWSSRAEGKVKELKAEIPRLKQLLAAADIAEYVDPNLRADISWFFGSWFSIGFWSWDGSQINGIQSDLSRLAGQLQPVRGQLEPRYYEYKGRVDGAVALRRRQILNQP
jgi:hypothetical protein